MDNMNPDRVALALLVFAWICARWAHLVSLKVPDWLRADWQHQAETFLAEKDTVMDPEASDALAGAAKKEEATHNTLDAPAPEGGSVVPRVAPPPAYKWWTPTRAPHQRDGLHRWGWLPFVGPALNKDWRGLWSEVWVILLSMLLLLSTETVALSGAVPQLSYSYVVGGIVLIAWLQALTNVDYKTQFLPDMMTIPLLWLGLLIAVSTKGLLSSTLAVQGAIVGYGMLWSLSKAFELLRKKQGMGGGDMKLIAAIGAWTGTQGALFSLGLASFLGLGFAVVLALRRKNFNKFAFGPSIATAGVIMYIAAPYFHLAVAKIGAN